MARTFALIQCLLLSLAFAAPPQKGVIVRGWANARAGPGRSFPVVKRVYEGEEFEVLEVRDQWVKLQLDAGTTGWVFSDLVQLTTATATDTTQAAPTPVQRSKDWLYVPLFLFMGVAGTALVYWALSRRRKLLDYADRLDRLTGAAYIDSVSREDVVRLTRAFGVSDRTAKSIARQIYLERYKVSSSHQKITDKEKGAFRKLQTVLALSDEDVMHIMAKVYKRRRRAEWAEA